MKDLPEVFAGFLFILWKLNTKKLSMHEKKQLSYSGFASSSPCHYLFKE